MNRPVDLRSDTVTKPCAEMRAAMAKAVVGDDVLGDDPTVQALEAMAAALVGKERGLFVPSGTMGNQLAVFTHTERGDEVLCGRPCHIQEHEVGAAAVISGVSLVPLDAPWGEISVERVADAIRDPDIHHPRTGLLCLEAAHGSGAVPSMDNLRAVSEPARSKGIPVHLDGARIFNAALALGVEAREIAGVADSVMFCLSKGLGAPVGSVLCGREAFVQRSRKGRKLLGGGMRQVGVLAAAGLYALTHNIERLAQDHRKAQILSKRLQAISAVEVLSRGRDINMVWFKLKRGGGQTVQANRVVAALRDRGVVIYPPLLGAFRLVCHMDVDDEALDYACRQFQEVFSAL